MGETPGWSSVQLATECWGSGPPVVFLHGLGGSARYWHSLASASWGYRGIAVDLLGFGQSPRPRSATYDVDEHLRVLVPTVPTGSVLVAHSTGAVLAGALAARHPDVVRALLLIGAPLYSDVSEARIEVRRMGWLARVTASGELAGPAACAVLHGLVQPLSRVLPLGLPQAVVRDFWEHDWRSYSRTLRQVVVGHPLGPDLARLTVPGTLLYGAQDRTGRRSLPQLLSRNPLLRAVQVPGDHHVAVRSPARTAKVLHAVLAQAPRGGPPVDL